MTLPQSTNLSQTMGAWVCLPGPLCIANTRVGVRWLVSYAKNQSRLGRGMMVEVILCICQLYFCLWFGGKEDVTVKSVEWGGELGVCLHSLWKPNSSQGSRGTMINWTGRGENNYFVCRPHLSGSLQACDVFPAIIPSHNALSWKRKVFYSWYNLCGDGFVVWHWYPLEPWDVENNSFSHLELGLLDAFMLGRNMLRYWGRFSGLFLNTFKIYLLKLNAY